MNIELIQLDVTQAKELMDLLLIYEDVFGMHDFEMPPVSYLEQLLEKEHILFFVARHNDRVVGGLTAYLLSSPYAETAEIYIYDLAVKTSYQRKGVGTQLVGAINAYCRDQKLKEVFVQADVADDYAIDFYRKTGGIAEDVIHFSYPVKN
jgi:ribosomal protein S18 acetylase RimI-like enzyme